MIDRVVQPMELGLIYQKYYKSCRLLKEYVNQVMPFS